MDTPSTLRIASWNIHKGFGLGNTRFLLDEMRQAIRLVDADIVFLQEVVGENHKHGHRVANWVPEQFEYLADEVWTHYAYGRNAIYEHGHHGNAILSKYPFSAWSQYDISILPTSQRGLLHGVIAGGVHLICVHMGLLGWERMYQATCLAKFIGREVGNAPLIMAGDFNDWRHRVDKTLRQRFGLKEAYHEKHGRLAATYPARWPLFRMDRVYYRGVECVQAERLSGEPWAALSDHCALYAEFRLPDGE
ncbi:MAG TPA: endonuclease/exonuclease/phosphatase family protein [Pseudomonadales bacterium]